MENLPNNTQENPYAAEWQNMGTEREKKELDPEQLRETPEMIEKLRDMGVDKRILENPAFGRILGGLISSYGLQMSQKYSIEFSESEDGKKLTLTYTGDKGDARYHDRGNMNLIVDDRGSLTVETACVDSENRLMEKGIFSGNQPKNLRGDGQVDTTKLENTSQISRFKITRDNRLIVEQKHAYEDQYIPSTHERGIGEYFVSVDSTTRHFDASGVEQYREDVQYVNASRKDMDGISPFVGEGSWSDPRPKHASFNILRTPSVCPDKEVSRRTTYSRNEDGSMKVFDYYEGKGVTIERCPMNTEHGTDELIAANYAISEARKAKAADNA